MSIGDTDADPCGRELYDRVIRCLLYTSFVSPYVREQLRLGNAPEIILTHYSDTDDFVRYRARPTILFCQVTPMDEEGYFTMGYNSLGHRVAAEMADRVIVQVNRNLPKIAGECNRLHIGEVTAIYEEDTPRCV